MSKTKFPSSFSNEDSKSFNDDHDKILEIEKTSTKMTNIKKSSNINSLKIATKSITEMNSSFSRYGLNGISNHRLDIDIDYAVELLKKEDQNINVFSHLRGILDKLFEEKPENPLEMFEEYSQSLKCTYNLNEENNFEKVFVDAINRNDCRKSLHVHKCALKEQKEKLKHFNNCIENIKSKSEENIFSDQVEIQNLWEMNHIFNKAECGLPTDEVSLISLTMHEMAQLNKFKSIRFWGKIFALKCIYYIIECEWTDAELNRKLLTGNSKSLAPDPIRQDSGNFVDPTDPSLSTMFKLMCEQINETDSVDSKLINSTDTNFDNEMTSNLFDDDDFSSNFSQNNSQLHLKTPSIILPPEKFGTGTNRNVYFFTNSLISEWTELDSVQPHHIVEARKIKRYFTGNLSEPLNSFPNFNGLEIDYLRAQIARISSSTHICPKGYYVIDRKGDDQSVKLDAQSTISSKSTTLINYDLTMNKNFKNMPSKNLIEPHSWVHKNPRIDDTGMTNKSDFPWASDSFMNNMDISDELIYLNEAEEEYSSYVEPLSKDNLFGNLINDITKDGMPAWKGVIFSPPNAQYMYTMMKSNLWPGAYAVTYKSKIDLVYIGWAQKQDSIWYSSSLMNELRMETKTYDNIIEYQIPDKSQTVRNTKQILNTHNKKNRILPIKQNRNAYKGVEKLIKAYTYS